MRAALLGIVLLFAAAAAYAFGPYDVTLVRVIDGDTFVARMAVFPQTTVETSIRVAGIDTPEMHIACQHDRAVAAQAWTEKALQGAKSIRVDIVQLDKYGGRYDAEVIYDGQSLAAGLIAAGLAHPYNGGTKPPWC